MVTNKERLTGGETNSESLKDRRADINIPKEAEYWLERAKRDDGNNQTVTDPGTGQTVLKPAAPTDPKIVLPVSRQGLTDGLKQGVDSAAKWLATFVLRLIKIKKGKVSFEEDNDA